MSDYRHLELSWLKGTKLFNAAQEYRYQNLGVKEHSDLVLPLNGGEDVDMLIHAIATSYNPTKLIPKNAKKFAKDSGLYHLNSSENMSEQIGFYNYWRHDLDGMNKILKYFNYSDKNFWGEAGLMFLKDTIDGADEEAIAHVWIGSDLLSVDFRTRKELNLHQPFFDTGNPNNNDYDYRVSKDDLKKLLDYAKTGDVVWITERTNFVDSSSLENLSKSIFPYKLPLSVKSKDNFFDGRAQFYPYSTISFEGNPLDVRKSVLKILQLSWNEDNMPSRWQWEKELGKSIPYEELGLKYPIHSQNLIYEQFKINKKDHKRA